MKNRMVTGENMKMGEALCLAHDDFLRLYGQKNETDKNGLRKKVCKPMIFK